MGFGTLFIGYFLLLNITYYTFTDLLAGLIMLLGLCKIASVSEYFKLSSYAAIGFTVFGLAELVVGGWQMLYPTDNMQTVISYLGIARAIILCAFTILMLRAMHDISKELDVGRLPLKCRTMTVWTAVLYVAEILLESTIITNIIPAEATAVLYIAVIIGMLVVVISNLTVIYSCYMHICMPEDLEPKPEKPSRFGFINEYRRRRDEKRAREAEEYRRRRQERAQRRGKK